MNFSEIIEKKKQGEALTKAEINDLVASFTQGTLPDYQMAAFLMAVYFKGMRKEEIKELTMAYVHSGEVMDLSSIEGIKVDKHSTGGVGDKISLIVLPVVAACGVPVAKLSGRGLGHTGGTIDKLEAIPGFRTDLSMEEFIQNIQKSGLALAGQTAQLTPADKKIYALRDVTGTVDSIPLIAASIMSKKIASGSDAIVLDVKTGEGAFMQNLEDAKELARTMVEIGKSLGRNTTAIITDMNEPLGHEIGNANEVSEALAILRGEEIPGLWPVALEVSATMIYLGQKAASVDEGKELVKEAISSGQALAKFKEFIEAQGGDASFLEDGGALEKGAKSFEIKSTTSGVIHSINALDIGRAAMHLGAGRKRKEDQIDHSAGIHLNHFVGDKVEAGEVLCHLIYNQGDLIEAQELAQRAFVIKAEPLDRKSPILDRIQ